MAPSVSKLTATMLIRNESGRYLEEVLSELSNFVDEMIILDDASADDTPDICSSFSKVILYRETEPLMTKDESQARNKLWDFTVLHDPEWILAIDADEVFEKRMSQEMAGLINQDEFDAVEFRLFDFWGDRQHYRVDGGWDPWVKKVRMLWKYNPNQIYTWPKQRLHCGRIPLEARASNQVYQSDIRVKHYGWIRKQDIDRKYLQYKELDESSHLKSVFDAPDQIKLEEWIPEKILPF
jgi:glycosyltransferase involved in cell wall biosynthesis